MVFFPRKLGDKKGRAESAQLVADVHFALASMGLGNPQEALKASQEAVQLYQELEMGWKGWFFTGMCYLSLCKYIYIHSYTYCLSVYIYIYIYV